MSSFLSLEGLTKRYGATTVVKSVSLTMERGRFLTLLGPSGSGKTTLLMMIAGVVSPSAGEIVLDGRRLTNTPPEKRNFGMVFQGYALFPHLNVEENVAFSLSVRGRAAAEIRQRVRRVLDMVQLSHLAARLPKQLSGGQQQRVAIARALAFDPDLLLLDEPLSALDKKLRVSMQEELRSLHRRIGTTFICVTHDQEEALSLSDEIAVLRDGGLVQVDTPQMLYNRPRTRFVADFLGCGNFLDGVVADLAEDHFRYRCGEQLFVQAGREPNLQQGDKVVLALRPEHIRVAVTRPDHVENSLQGSIVSASYSGAHHQVMVDVGSGTRLVIAVPSGDSDMSMTVGAPVWLGWTPEATVRVDGD
jgi:putative spermidine/putrescine transport system ATP-binding protein